MEGWIKLHRKSLDHWLYNENRAHTRREAWEDILLLCNHSDTQVLISGELIDCKRGQSIMSLKSWARTFKWSIQQVRAFFKLLENDSMIKTEGLKYSTRITVCNYEIYQNIQQAENKLKTNSQQTGNELKTTNNNEKNEKNEKREKTTRFSPPSLPDIQDYFTLKIQEKRYQLNPVTEAEKFLRHYESNNWHVGKNKMSNWKSAVSGWILRSIENYKPPNGQSTQPDGRPSWRGKKIVIPDDPLPMGDKPSWRGKVLT